MKKPTEKAAENQQRPLSTFWRGLLIVFSAIAIVFAVNDVFNLRLFNVTIMENSYFYILIALLVSLVFILYPLKKGLDTGFFFLIDVVLFCATIGICLYFAWHGMDIVYKGWSAAAPKHAQVLSLILWILVMEALRRSSGLVIAVVVLILSMYPLFASVMPGPLEGLSFPLFRVATFHALGDDSLLGIPMQVLGRLVLGFILFGVALQITGGGKFFLDLATALFAHFRGGPAKVSVFASALFGSMSGSVPANVVTTGSFTIPIMKQSGFEGKYAGAIEACASTGGVLMPPIMGATAFIMASFMGVTYLSVVKAAIIPSLLYYFGLFIHVDAYAAINGLKGLPKNELPSLVKVMKEGWFYALALVLLIVLLFYRLEARAAYFTAVLIFILTNFNKDSRLSVKKMLQFFEQSGRLLAGLTTIFVAVGMIIGSMSLTGAGHSLSREIVALAGGNLALLLMLGAIASFILGMGMTITACYIFLAVVLAPALVQSGLNQMAVHLFVLYCAVLSYITPPVAIAAFSAQPLAGAPAMSIATTASKLSTINYLLPFLFVLHPSLILNGPISGTILNLIPCVLGILCVNAGLHGYLLGIGTMRLGNRGVTLAMRAGYFVGGFLMALQVGYTLYAGLVITVLTLLMHVSQRRRRALSLP